MGFGRRDSIPEGSGAYELWVGTLRSWSHDSSVSLDGLPELSETAYDRESFARFSVHLSEAVKAFMVRWDQQLGEGFARAATPHDLAVEMVRMRNLLRPRLELARHPGLPEGIRSALIAGLTADTSSIQAQLEDSVRRNTSRGSIDPGQTDTLLRIVRENSLVSIVPSTVPIAPWLPPSGQAASPPPAPTRKIFLPRDTPTN